MGLSLTHCTGTAVDVGAHSLILAHWCFLQFLMRAGNLLSNAIKFTHAGFCRLVVSVVAETPAAATLKFCVEDTGEGIDPGDQATIWKEYKQVGCKIGTGLGLPLSRGIVALMGGSTLSVVSPWTAAAPPPAPGDAMCFRQAEGAQRRPAPGRSGVPTPQTFP